MANLSKITQISDSEIEAVKDQVNLEKDKNLMTMNPVEKIASESGVTTVPTGENNFRQMKGIVPKPMENAGILDDDQVPRLGYNADGSITDNEKYRGDDKMQAKVYKKQMKTIAGTYGLHKLVRMAISIEDFVDYMMEMAKAEANIRAKLCLKALAFGTKSTDTESDVNGIPLYASSKILTNQNNQVASTTLAHVAGSNTMAGNGGLSPQQLNIALQKLSQQGTDPFARYGDKYVMAVNSKIASDIQGQDKSSTNGVWFRRFTDDFVPAFSRDYGPKYFGKSEIGTYRGKLIIVALGEGKDIKVDSTGSVNANAAQNKVALSFVLGENSIKKGTWGVDQELFDDLIGKDVKQGDAGDVFRLYSAMGFLGFVEYTLRPTYTEMGNLRNNALCIYSLNAATQAGSTT